MKRVNAELVNSQRDFVRLNATSPMHALQLVREKAEEFWGFEVGDFFRSSTSGVNICQKASYDTDKYIIYGGITVTMSGKNSERLKDILTVDRFPGISNLLFGRYGFTGFETCSGTPGECDKYAMKMGLRARLKDFPLIEERYKQWCVEEVKSRDYSYSWTNAKKSGQYVAKSSKEYQEIVKLYNYHSDCVRACDEALREVLGYHESEYLRLWLKANPKPDRDGDLENDFEGCTVSQW